ncbi:MAG: aminotransferase class III-fold pyridoxal phosphate-dependent enzyme [bacterium]|nr:aminotransferase class III-fold pyridoxal phosphate-dependent enzyme [bacterium]
MAQNGAKRILGRRYGLEGELRRLPGENENYLVTATDGRRFVLKIGLPDANPADVDLERVLAVRIASADIGLAAPELLPADDGSFGVLYASGDGTQRPARLMRFVTGTPWSEAGAPSTARLRDLGGAVARMIGALESVSHPATDRTHAWDLARACTQRPAVDRIDDADRRRVLDAAFQLYSACALPRLSELRRSVIHGDVNDENVLVEGDRVTGILDFGDSLINPTVCELAIALAYAMLALPQPLAAAAQIVRGHHAVRPLDEVELDVLFPLVCGRLALSVSIAAQRPGDRSENPNWFVTEEPAWRLLTELAGQSPRAARELLCGEIPRDPPRAPPATGELLEHRARRIGPSLSVAYRAPLQIVRGAGQYLYDEEGRPYLDLINNVCHVGHCHPRVVEAGAKQMARLNTNTRYLHRRLVDYAERLCATLPDPLRVCWFVCSGSEANELAVRLARAHTGRHDMLVLDGAYHGHTNALIELSPYKFLGPGGAGTPAPHVHVVPVPDGYRGPHRGQGRDAGQAYGDEVGRAIETSSRPPAAFIAESLMGCGGQIVPPDGYFERAFEHVRRAGGVCIADEVHVGFGRVGHAFWGFELQDVVPDIVVLGKPIGNGHPMAAVITTQEIAASFDNGMEFFSTFGGNPVSCAIGMAVLDVIEEQGLQRHAARLGERLSVALRELQSRHAIVGDVRGSGLFLGVELVRDRETLEPAGREATEAVERLRADGMLVATDGPLNNVIKIKPPLVLTEGDAEMFVRGLDAALGDVARR